MKKVKVSIIAPDIDWVPCYQTELASGADLSAYIDQDVSILPGTIALIPTGIQVAIPDGYEIQIRPRSGLAMKNQVTVLNTPGTIDADYRGEIKVILMNQGKETFVVSRGMRIAQMVLVPVVQAQFEYQTEPLMASTRGEGGFGHTGTH